MERCPQFRMGRNFHRTQEEKGIKAGEEFTLSEVGSWLAFKNKNISSADQGSSSVINMGHMMGTQGGGRSQGQRHRLTIQE